ncbi:MAG: hypothetical protein ACLGI2_04055 [Acidimicrobiia bacterium]
MGNDDSFEDDALRRIPMARRQFVRRLVAGAAFTVPLVRSMGGAAAEETTSPPPTSPPPTSPQDMEACLFGGWRALSDDQGRPFKNQGDCVSFVASRQRNPAGG